MGKPWNLLISLSSLLHLACIPRFPTSPPAAAAESAVARSKHLGGPAHSPGAHWVKIIWVPQIDEMSITYILFIYSSSTPFHMYYRHEHALGALFDSVRGQKRLPLIQQFFPCTARWRGGSPVTLEPGEGFNWLRPVPLIVDTYRYHQSGQSEAPNH